MLAPARSDDPCPMAVVEALADGVPVLGSARGGIPELVGDDAALPPEDTAAWAAALAALWADPARRAAAGAAALARAHARHAPEAWYAGLLDVYGRAEREPPGRVGADGRLDGCTRGIRAIRA